jgi:LasA protease
MSLRRRAALLAGGVIMLAGLAFACNLPGRQTPPLDFASQMTLAAELFPATPFTGLQTAALPGAPPQFIATGDPNVYYAQAGDTLLALARRYRIQPGQIIPPFALDAEALIPAGLPLRIPQPAGDFRYRAALLPDSEVIYSPAAADFDLAGYIRNAGGYLSRHQEEVDGETLDGVEVVRRVALDTSINPRLLLAAIEYRRGWVTGGLQDAGDLVYPFGFGNPQYQGLYKGLLLVTRQLTLGYYGWRSGALLEAEFTDGSRLPIHPSLNAGTLALLNLLAKLETPQTLPESAYGVNGFTALYVRMFGDPWARAAAIEPLFPPDLRPPELELPFQPGYTWSLTGGPHPAYGVGNAWGGVDFAPASGKAGCQVSPQWVTASAPGWIVRSERGQVLQDLDGDGIEQTGWTLLYLHIAAQDRIPAGAYLETDERIGHPSCEGGVASGAHVHLARKYNGEWIAASPALPLVLSGWTVEAGEKPYQGRLIKDGQVIVPRSEGSAPSQFQR